MAMLSKQGGAWYNEWSFLTPGKREMRDGEAEAREVSRGRMRSAAAHIIKGFVIIIIAASVGKFIFEGGWESLSGITSTFHDYATAWLKLDSVIMSSKLREFAYLGISVAVLFLLAWFIGRLKFAKLISALRRRDKGLFCVRMKNCEGFDVGGFPWTYLVGVVMREYQGQGKTYYNICFPNLAGFIVLYKVPQEATQRVDVEPEDLMASIPFLGAMDLKGL
ncbi:MAG: hypothetical protein HY456_01995 [Parcubacteria group bacterium]|nr:hypothetical protein [Parcubacteria group bacterium]